MGHLERVPEERPVKQIYIDTPLGRRPPARPQHRYMGNIQKDLLALNVVLNWNAIAKDRDKRRRHKMKKIRLLAKNSYCSV